MEPERSVRRVLTDFLDNGIWTPTNPCYSHIEERIKGESDAQAIDKHTKSLEALKATTEAEIQKLTAILKGLSPLLAEIKITQGELSNQKQTLVRKLSREGSFGKGKVSA